MKKGQSWHSNPDNLPREPAYLDTPVASEPVGKGLEMESKVRTFKD